MRPSYCHGAGLVVLAACGWAAVLSVARADDPLVTLRGHTHGVTAVAFSPNGATLASGGWDRTVRLWDTATGSARRTLGPHAHRLTALSFSPDGRSLAAGGGYDNKTGELRTWDPATATVRWEVADLPGTISRVRFSPDGKLLAAAMCKPHEVRVYDADTGRERVVFRKHTREVLDIAFTPDGKTVASGGPEGTVRLWSPLTGEEEVVIALPTFGDATVVSVGFTPDGKTLFGGCHDGTVRFWDVATRGLTAAFLAHRGQSVGRVALSADGKLMATAAFDETGVVKIWGPAWFSPHGQFLGHNGSVTWLDFSPNGKLLATTGSDSTIKLWKTPVKTPRVTTAPQRK